MSGEGRGEGKFPTTLSGKSSKSTGVQKTCNPTSSPNPDCQNDPAGPTIPSPLCLSSSRWAKAGRRPRVGFFLFLIFRYIFFSWIIFSSFYFSPVEFAHSSLFFFCWTALPNRACRFCEFSLFTWRVGWPLLAIRREARRVVDSGNGNCCNSQFTWFGPEARGKRESVKMSIKLKELILDT